LRWESHRPCSTGRRRDAPLASAARVQGDSRASTRASAQMAIVGEHAEGRAHILPCPAHRPRPAARRSRSLRAFRRLIRRASVLFMSFPRLSRRTQPLELQPPPARARGTIPAGSAGRWVTLERPLPLAEAGAAEFSHFSNFSASHKVPQQPKTYTLTPRQRTLVSVKWYFNIIIYIIIFIYYIKILIL